MIVWYCMLIDADCMILWRGARSCDTLWHCASLCWIANLKATQEPMNNQHQSSSIDNIEYNFFAGKKSVWSNSGECAVISVDVPSISSFLTFLEFQVPRTALLQLQGPLWPEVGKLIVVTSLHHWKNQEQLKYTEIRFMMFHDVSWHIMIYLTLTFHAYPPISKCKLIVVTSLNNQKKTGNIEISVMMSHDVSRYIMISYDISEDSDSFMISQCFVMFRDVLWCLTPTLLRNLWMFITCSTRKRAKSVISYQIVSFNIISLCHRMQSYSQGYLKHLKTL